MKACLLILLFSPAIVFAGKNPERSEIASSKNKQFTSYDWELQPKAVTLSDEEKNEDCVILFEKRGLEFAQSEIYELIHVIKYLNTDKGIEENNKIYFYGGSGINQSDILTLKARVIKPSGAIIELDDDAIIKKKEGDGSVQMHYFALEGIEKGSVVEYLIYTKVVGAMSQSKTFYLGDDYPKRRFEVDVFCSKTLFKVSHYSSNPKFALVQQESEEKKASHYSLRAENIAKILDEPYALNERNGGQIWVFGLFSVAKDPSYYQGLSDQMHSGVFNANDQLDRNAVKNYIDEVQSQFPDANTLALFRIIENKIKTEIVCGDDVPQSMGMRQILKTKQASSFGLLRLFWTVMEQMSIANELQFSCDRNYKMLPETFESPTFIQSAMFYLPSCKLYLSLDIDDRLGMAPEQVIGNNAVKIIRDPAILNPSPKIVAVPVPEAAASVDMINSTVRINPASATADILLERSLSGYRSTFYQSGFDHLIESRKEERRRNFFQYVLKDATIIDFKCQNDRSEDYMFKPFCGQANLTSNTLVTAAGSKLLVNAGLLIGPQVFMPVEETRVQNVDFEHPHAFSRTITIHIPEGYTVANAADFALDVFPADLNNKVGFRSTYTLSGNILTITIYEVYDGITFPPEAFASIAEVYNTAVKFNGLKLVLVK